ncbi:MAG: OmpH family outer membrane protein [Paludibacteraceae bacterium]|nr:OmpH family outer membrane protein [Paludibacteraceae bacterium]
MNKIHLSIELVLAAAVVALFVIVFNGRSKAPEAPQPVAATVVEGAMPVAYLNVDSLLLQYTYAQEMTEKLLRKQEDARLKLNTKARTLQKEMEDFQRKLENNAFLSRERAENEQQRLLRKQQELEDLDAKLTQEIMTENQKFNMQLADTLMAFLKDFNADGRYQIILSNNAKDNILMAAEGYDITSAVVSGLNSRYTKKK